MPAGRASHRNARAALGRAIKALQDGERAVRAATRARHLKENSGGGGANNARGAFSS